MSGLAVVTGCSTGIGRATAVALHERGYDVVATMRDADKGADLPCRVEALDVDDDASVQSVFAGLGAVDVLVNNAGVAGLGSTEDAALGLFRSVMETNFFGAVRCAQHVIPGMRQRGGGCIVNVSSVAGRMTTPVQGAYHASKFALEGWSEVLAAELVGFGVRVAIIEPGVVLTPIWTKPADPASSAYARLQERTVELLFANARHGTTSEDAAAVILDAITTESPRLRWPVGPDADQLLARAAATSDDERVAVHAIDDDREYWAEMRRLYGPDVLPDAG